MPYAKETLANFITRQVQDVARVEVLDPRGSAGKVYEEPRIYDNLLTSQALCFNLFGELQRDLALASQVVGQLLGEEIEAIGVEFEHSPGRSDPRFTADRSAFDAFVTYTSPTGRGFLGIEVKYAESLDDRLARHRSRYDEVAQAMRCFGSASLPRLRQKPLQQFWRNHLMAGSLLLDEPSGFNRGAFVVLYPSQNTVVRDAALAYRACLTDDATLRIWTLESVLDVLRRSGEAAWKTALRDRYLG
jgi:hypothetical protein